MLLTLELHETQGFSKEERTCPSGLPEQLDTGQARGRGVSTLRSSLVLSSGRVATLLKAGPLGGPTEKGSCQDPT